MKNNINIFELDQNYRHLNDVNDKILDALIDCQSLENINQKINGIIIWKNALFQGVMPEISEWPPEELILPWKESLKKLNIVKFCKNQSDLVQEILIDLIHSCKQQQEELNINIKNKLKELDDLQKNSEKFNEDEMEEWLQQMKDLVLQERPTSDRHFEEKWEGKARMWAQVWDVFGDLGLMMGRGWDLSLGVLRQAGWTHLLNLQKLMETLPQLREVVKILGQLQHSQEGESVEERIFTPILRIEEERREVRTPWVPAEVRGVERSGDIARMLPTEASLLVHPTLRLLWHARRAERALMTYRVEGVEWERTLVEREVLEAVDGQKPRPQRGPIIVIIDTSGSMHGTPELVAKALSLEALKQAHAEQRRCFLYAYSGPGQILEHELSLSPEGLGSLFSFLSYTFGGGNDESGVIKRVVDRLQQENWTRADVLMVSDGEWPAPSYLLASVSEAKAKKTRFHGVQIGNKGRTGLHEICDVVHIFREWAEVAAWS
jgi:uncharacterized protein with von Willebrand factor type A (vWA) domain